jgi:CBS domain-containing protein
MVKVKEVMKSYVVTIAPSAALEEVAKIMSSNKIGSVVVVDNGRPTGIITDSDVVAAAAGRKDLRKTKVSSLSLRRLITTAPEEDLMKAARVMVKDGIKRLPVVDKGKLVGILTDKEVLSSTPEMIEILSERLKARCGVPLADSSQTISGICEDCEGYSDDLKQVNDQWLCEDCRTAEA